MFPCCDEDRWCIQKEEEEKEEDDDDVMQNEYIVG